MHCILIISVKKSKNLKKLKIIVIKEFYVNFKKKLKSLNDF